mgnify:CR=1 FL=1
MFENQKFITRGVLCNIPAELADLMWHMVLTPAGQHIVHEQEQPPYRYELDVPCDDAVNAKVFVIDDLTHSTMLLAEEY